MSFTIINRHCSATTLKRPADKLNNIDHHVTIQCSVGNPWVLELLLELL